MRGDWTTLASALTAQLGISVVDQGIPTLTGFVKNDLRLSAATAGLVVSAFPAGKILGSYAAGVAADRLGERQVLALGGIATGLCICVTILLPPPVLFSLFVAAGFGAAAATPAGGRLVLTAFPPNRHGLALGIRQAAIPAGGLLAAVLLPAVALDVGWRWALVVAGVFAVVGVLPLRAGVSDARYTGDSSTLAFRALLRNRSLRLLTLWGCLATSGQLAVLVFLALDLRQSRGISLAAASLFVALAQGAGMVGRILWGVFSDRSALEGRKRMLVLVTLAGIATALVLAVVPASMPIAGYVVLAAFAGASLMGYQGVWMTMVAGTVGPARVGTATGLSVTCVLISVIATPPLLGLAADITGSYRAVWGVVVGALAAALLPALALDC